MTRYYDFILGLIPLALVSVTAALNVVGVALSTAVPLGAGVSVLLVGHALFVNGPVDTASSSSPGSAPNSGRFNSAD
ncbi:hypothetical protein [Halomicrococcus sp. NG-SE-24]|uniref:hypothetical protein n=1 Tax=Halomicrococcus sp. NG-SE-24 TaxID=3436928 RepID=UPI003D98AE9A